MGYPDMGVCPQPQLAHPSVSCLPPIFSRSTGISTPRRCAWQVSRAGCSTWPAVPSGSTWVPAATPLSPNWPCHPPCDATSSCPSRGSSPEGVPPPPPPKWG